jgi:hypothetical protein
VCWTQQQEIRIDSLDPGLVYAINAGRFFVKSGSPAALASKVLDKWINSLGTLRSLASNACRDL